jgi:hypothetical protein
MAAAEELKMKKSNNVLLLTLIIITTLTWILYLRVDKENKNILNDNVEVLLNAQRSNIKPISEYSNNLESYSNNAKLNYVLNKYYTHLKDQEVIKDFNAGMIDYYNSTGDILYIVGYYKGITSTNENPTAISVWSNFSNLTNKMYTSHEKIYKSAIKMDMVKDYKPYEFWPVISKMCNYFKSNERIQR